jgi:hypothetical protein
VEAAVAQRAQVTIANEVKTVDRIPVDLGCFLMFLL